MVFVLMLIIPLAALLIIAVLIQPGKGDLSANFGGVGTGLSSMFGTRRATDLMTKITIGLAVSLFVLSILTNKFLVGSSVEEELTPVTVGAQAPTSVPSNSTPIQQAPQQQNPAPAQQQQPAAAPQGK